MSPSGATPVGRSVPHESAPLHVSGKAQYIDDLPEMAGTLHAAPGLSTCARGRIRAMDLSAVRAYPGVRCVLTAADIPGENNCGPILHDDPIITGDLVEFYGQVIFVVAAETREAARQAARLARVEYAAEPPILDMDSAIAAESWVLPPFVMTRGAVEQAFENAPHRLSGAARLGGQEHFYLEGQISCAVPRESDTIHVFCSTQHPTEMQQMVAHALGWRSHQVSVECRRMGGGFGGKESQSAQWACLAALLAVKTGHPVKLRLDRDDDMVATGKRHPYQYRWESAFDDAGRILGLRLEMASDCGYSADLSGPVNDRTICHIDNAYYLDAVALRSLRCKTNRVSNTAFRGFGGPQGMFVIETVLDDIARHLGLDALAVREANFYDVVPGARSTTPYGMTVEDNVAPALVAQLADASDYGARRAAILAFNASSPVIKRGLALTPVKFGISFNATHYNQAGALVHVYTDGTVLVSHGGTEMGQGLYTKVRQIVAHEFGLPLEDVRLSSTDTSRVANTSATAASSGTDLNGKAAQAACQHIKARLAAFVVELVQGAVAAEQVRFVDARVQAGEASAPLFDDSFAALVMRAYRARIQLWDAGFYRTPKIHFDPQTKLGRPFYYFAYGAAASEVAIDTLTGECRVLRVDVLHDAGRSINPALDIGQIEGGFIQGMGWLTSEELWWRPDGPQAGRLMSHAPSTYKIPTATDLPDVFNVRLFDNANVEDSIHRSKAVGEPPFMLALSVFMALRDAVAAALPAGQSPRLEAPATPEAVLRALGCLAPEDGA
ncbi:MAG TPA: xanthine dehydrogenase molybdopterin binding subunit [Zoogloea sp.]|uniref:xanthine dehydrogenase molybdopterin binding subunit n=1 Tax=Zoogloea sp. TaxID=49181 RepID=UPI002B984FCC|nr:xanthine dehydrogenase molybdopterin binding subunit [Zoogloea sp.]HMV61788.1 xanthine dehydrogenase molybdopterin binding subunit [Rhodocyclaceae bacterium]HNA66234.1 xanthine dehydrogenase molybdopterin binding subunit [Rhodocyclaceae bacterium]HNB63136.1 xanthine dehydrogenase molybdopterin binding subunit [Rhodocyclaceae bacterium]HNH14940.1 xanthine dehydrogenase molybdopterin binding subunit [Zoogloea sp.]HNI46597.1 xanthine dehydrogenase molybdopterin binding subunit [Zoogloea sp.]